MRRAVIVSSPATIAGSHGTIRAATEGKSSPPSSPATRQARAWVDASLRICTTVPDHDGVWRMLSGSHVASSGNQIRTKTISTMIANIGRAARVI